MYIYRSYIQTVKMPGLRELAIILLMTACRVRAQVPAGSCTFAWREYTSTSGGGSEIFQNTQTSVAACQTTCLAAQNCVSIDWDLTDGLSNSLRCYFRSETTQNASASRTNYRYEAHCSLDSGTDCSFYYAGDYSFTTDLTTSTGVSTESECLQDCTNQATCISAAFKSGATDACQLTSTVGETDSRTQDSGRRHYIRDTCTVVTTTTAEITTTTAAATTTTAAATTTTVAPITTGLEIFGIQPSFGPIAGGTNVTIFGEKLDSINEIYLGNVIPAIIVRESNTIMIEMPAVNATRIDDVLPLIVELDGVRVTYIFTFVYKPDPVIEAIYPLDTILSGGTILNINGSHMDSVSSPVLSVILVNRTFINNVHDDKRETFTSSCHKATTILLKCTVPEMDIGQTTTIQSQNKTTINFRTDVSELTFYFGLILDGVTRYQNVSRVTGLEKYGVIDVFYNPTLSTVDVIRYEEGVPLEIRGKNLDRGINTDDYKVEIGQGLCVNQQLSFSRLTCWPPKEPLKKRERQNFTYHQIVVHIGSNLKHQYGEMSYGSNEVGWPVIVGSTVGSVTIIIVIVVTSVLITRQKRQGPHLTQPPQMKTANTTSMIQMDP